MIWIIAGLGNPGKSYEKHRHNVGAQLIDALQKAFAFPELKQKDKLASARGELEGRAVMLCKPLTYMNHSGEALVSLARYIGHAKIMIIHDELDLPLGTVRFKEGGGSGGHNGLKSISHLMGPDYARLRMGIGHPGQRELVSDYVLSPFSCAEKPIIQDNFYLIISLLPLLIKDQKAIFLQSLHGS